MNDDNVTVLDVVTSLDCPAERILQDALDEGLETVVVVGYDADGNEYFASSVASGGTALWLMERAKLKLLTIMENDT